MKMKVIMPCVLTQGCMSIIVVLRENGSVTFVLQIMKAMFIIVIRAEDNA